MPHALKLIKLHIVLKHYFLKCKTSQKTLSLTNADYSGSASIRIVYKWLANCPAVYISMTDTKHPRWTVEVTTPKMIDKIWYGTGGQKSEGTWDCQQWHIKWLCAQYFMWTFANEETFCKVGATFIYSGSKAQMCEMLWSKFALIPVKNCQHCFCTDLSNNHWIIAIANIQVCEKLKSKFALILMKSRVLA